MSIKVEWISYLWYINTMEYYTFQYVRIHTVMRLSDIQLYAYYH